MSEVKVSVRARRKLETISLIHDIAEKLALKNGLAEAKIEDIADAAGISKRTFFNYFPTKEDAVLGLRAPSLSREAIDQFNASSADLLTRTVMLAIDVVRTSSISTSSIARRKELRRRFPELTQRFELRAIATEELIRPILADHVSRTVSDEAPGEVDIILNLAGVVIRHAYSIDPEIKDDSITQSIQIFKSTIRKRL